MYPETAFMFRVFQFYLLTAINCKNQVQSYKALGNFFPKYMNQLFWINVFQVRQYFDFYPVEWSRPRRSNEREHPFTLCY